MKDLTVYYEGEPQYSLNKDLLDSKNCWDKLEEIKETHWFKLMLYEMIRNHTDTHLLKSLAADITECEFRLQELWGLPQEIRFHKFWKAPKCQCAKWDNEDSYPSGYYIVTMSCPLHGTEGSCSTQNDTML